MNNRRKVCVVITARPSYARVKTVLSAIQAHADLDLQLVVGASALLERYGSVVDVMQADGFTPTERVYMVVEGENPVTSAKSTGLGIVELATALDNLRPTLVITVADRYETIATAIAASYLNIPVAHLQGGEVTGSIDDRVRHAVTKLADVHFVSNGQAARRVIQMGEDESRVHITGCPSIDLAAAVAREPVAAPLHIPVLLRGVGRPFAPEGDFLVVMQHPVATEYGDARSQMVATLNAVARVGIPTYWFWPNVDAGSDHASAAIRRFRETEDASGLYFVKNLPPEDFLRLLVRARCLVGNSSVGVREASFLGVPVVNVGSRQDGRDRASNVVDVPHDSAHIASAIRQQVQRGPYARSELYGNGGAGQRIANVIATMALGAPKRLSY